MSLLDAFLEEGHLDPRDIYVAMRSDGQRGSGTIADPFDGGTRNDPAIPATVSFDLLEEMDYPNVFPLRRRPRQKT